MRRSKAWPIIVLLPLIALISGCDEDDSTTEKSKSHNTLVTSTPVVIVPKSWPNSNSSGVTKNLTALSAPPSSNNLLNVAKNNAIFDGDTRNLKALDNTTPIQLGAMAPKAVAYTAAARPNTLPIKEVPPVESTLDEAFSQKLADVIKARATSFKEYCYASVKIALQKTGLITDSNQLYTPQYGTHAYQFNKFVEKNPALLHRNLLPLKSPSWPLPIGAIVVWSPGACGYSAESGHIEIITRNKPPPQACSDGCGTFQVACLNKLSSDPGLAAAELPQAQKEFDQAQADSNALKTPAKDSKSVAAHRKAAVVLAQKKTALAAVKARLEPKVSVYVVERPAKS